MEKRDGLFWILGIVQLIIIFLVFGQFVEFLGIPSRESPSYMFVTIISLTFSVSLLGIEWLIFSNKK